MAERVSNIEVDRLRVCCARCQTYVPRYYVVGNACLDCLGTPAAPIDPNRKPVSPADHDTRHNRLLASLSPHQREVYESFYSDRDPTQAEVAEAMGISQQAVAKSLRLIRRKLNKFRLPEPRHPATNFEEYNPLKNPIAKILPNARTKRPA